MALLWQDIAQVPGLTGSWRERLDQYSQRLYGTDWNGLRDTGIQLQNEIKKGNYGLPQQPEQTQQPVVQPAQTPADVMKQYTDPFTGQITRAAEVPLFQDYVGDYMDVWDKQFAPGVQAAAESQINPESVRNFNQDYENYMGNLVTNGGQRFGRGFNQDMPAGGGMAGVGNLRAAAERNRQALVQDWMGQQKSGIENLWYNPTKDAWNLAKTQLQPGGVMNDYTMTAEDAMAKYGNVIGTGESKSPFYG